MIMTYFVTLWYPPPQSGVSLRMQVAAPITALAFSPSVDVLAIGFASNHVWVYDVVKARPSAWSSSHSTGLPSRLLGMPGTLRSLSFSPAPQVPPPVFLLRFTPGTFYVVLPQGITHLHTKS